MTTKKIISVCLAIGGFISCHVANIYTFISTTPARTTDAIHPPPFITPLATPKIKPTVQVHSYAIDTKIGDVFTINLDPPDKSKKGYWRLKKSDSDFFDVMSAPSPFASLLPPREKFGIGLTSIIHTTESPSLTQNWTLKAKRPGKTKLVFEYVGDEKKKKVGDTVKKIRYTVKVKIKGKR